MKTLVVSNLIDGLLFGLIVGLVIGLALGLLSISIGGLLWGVNLGLVVWLISTVTSGVLSGLFGVLTGGLEPVIKHVSLRIVLYRSGTSPWNYAKFLEHAENHRFIPRVGGRYRFVHDLLRKRFAARYQPRYR